MQMSSAPDPREINDPARALSPANIIKKRNIYKEREKPIVPMMPRKNLKNTFPQQRVTHRDDEKQH